MILMFNESEIYMINNLIKKSYIFHFLHTAINILAL